MDFIVTELDPQSPKKYRVMYWYPPDWSYFEIYACSTTEAKSRVLSILDTLQGTDSISISETGDL